MSDKSSIHNADAEAEHVRPVRSGPGFFSCLLIVLLLAGLTVNIVLIRGQLQQQARTTAEHYFWLLNHAGSTEQERTRAFLFLIKAGNEEWRGARLNELKLMGSDLQAVDLSQANLVAVDLSGSTLSDAKLISTNFDTANLSDTDLYSADLLNATLVRADLRKSRFGNARLNGASLEQADAAGANFDSAEVLAANCVFTNFEGADLSNADFQGTTLKLAQLVGTNVTNTNFADCVLDEANLLGCNWWRAVGLSQIQIEELTQTFKPDERWAPELLKDFESWQEGD